MEHRALVAFVLKLLLTNAAAAHAMVYRRVRGQLPGLDRVRRVQGYVLASSEVTEWPGMLCRVIAPPFDRNGGERARAAGKTRSQRWRALPQCCRQAHGPTASHGHGCPQGRHEGVRV